MNDMKSAEFGTWTLEDIIKRGFFRIPDYQRGYAWGERQLQEFWDDVMDVVSSGNRHYTGSITVERENDAEAGEVFAIVDGQQRMITMAILLSVLKHDQSPFMVNDDGRTKFVLSYYANNTDRAFFEALISDQKLSEPVNSYQRNLKRAREYFESKPEVNTGLDKIANAVMQKLAFDFRILGRDFNSGIVFETMNNRGKPLTLLEKLKNRLMYLTSVVQLDGDGEEDDKAELRAEINEAWSAIYRQLASNPKQAPLDEDEFVAAHLSVYRAPKESVYSKAVAEARLFKMFCKEAERHPKSERIDENDLAAVAKAKEKGENEEEVSLVKIRDYIEDLQKFAKPWADMYSDFKGPLGRCQLLSETQEVKVFLATVLCDTGDNEKETRNSIFENAEKILFRNTVKSVMDEAAFVTLARRLHGKCLDMLRRGDNDEIDANGVNQELRDIVNDKNRKLSVKQLIDYFADRMDRQQSPYGFYGWSGLKYFLFLHEGVEGLDWQDFHDTSLEHVIPQSSTADNNDGWWSRQVNDFLSSVGYGDGNVRTDADRKVCRQRKRQLVNSLGNFVLLTQSENASVSDDPWEGYNEVAGEHRAVIGKQAFYSDLQHTSSTTARQVAQTDGSWNAFKVRERGRKLFRELATSIEAIGALDDSDVDLALGFNDTSLEDVKYRSLGNDTVKRLAPRLGTADEPRHRVRQPNGADSDEAKICSRFWEGMQQWCASNDSNFNQELSVVHEDNKKSRWFENCRWEGQPISLFIDLRDNSRATTIKGPLVVIGVYCQGQKGVAVREKVLSACWPTLKENPQGCANDLEVAAADGTYKNRPDSKTARICFFVRCNWRDALDNKTYEKIVKVCKQIKGTMQDKGFISRNN